MDVFTAAAVALDEPLSIATDAWNTGRLPVDPGRYDELMLYPFDTYVDNGYGLLVPASLTLSAIVEQKRYFGQLPIEQLSGFEDQHTGMIITNAFTTGMLDWESVRSNWQHLKDGEEPPQPVALKIQGLQYIGHD
jgi:hypothetical protein